MKIDIEIKNLTLNMEDGHINNLDRNEFDILKENIERIMNNDIVSLDMTTERYIRYLQEIDNWLSYDYLKNEIIDFLNEHDNQRKYKLMVSIDMTLFKFLR